MKSKMLKLKCLTLGELENEPILFIYFKWRVPLKAYYTEQNYKRNTFVFTLNLN